MAERLLAMQLTGEPLPEITAGEILRETPNFRVVTDFKPGFEGTRVGERFFIEPRSAKGLSMLFAGAKAHNVFNFNFRPLEKIRTGGIDIIPCLRADYVAENIPVLLQGVVEIPHPGEDTIPSPDRMEECLQSGKQFEYTFADDLPAGYGIPNPSIRHLRLLQMTFKDEIPDNVIHSNNPDSYFKVRKNWWYGVCLSLSTGLEDGEFSNPSLLSDIHYFLEQYYNPGFINPGNLTTSEDIEEANRLLARIWEFSGVTSE